jgi:hypothetical protein
MQQLLVGGLELLLKLKTRLRLWASKSVTGICIIPYRAWLTCLCIQCTDLTNARVFTSKIAKKDQVNLEISSSTAFLVANT